MRVMIVSDSANEPKSIAKHLVERAHSVVVVPNATVALARLDDAASEIVIIDWTSSKAVVDLLGRLRSVEGDRHVYTIVMMTDPVASNLAAAFAAGADDLLRRPFLREELLARVGAIERIRRWAAKIMSSADLLGDISLSQLWRGAGSTIGRDLGELFDRSLELRTSPREPTSKVVIADIPLSLAEGGIECRLQLAFDDTSLAPLAAMLLGGATPSADALGDLVREIANVAGGALIGAADSEGMTFTLGVPTSTPFSLKRRPERGTVQAFTLGVVGTTIEICIRILLESHELKKIAPSQLREGMVVARSILGVEGALMLRAGTRLTESAIGRLTQLLPHGARVEVLAP